MRYEPLLRNETHNGAEVPTDDGIGKDVKQRRAGCVLEKLCSSTWAGQSHGESWSHNCSQWQLAAGAILMMIRKVASFESRA